MLIEMLKAKLHRAVLTQCELNYTGSISIDRDLLDMAGILPFEKVLVVNQNNGQRLETYTIEAPRGSREFCLNGAAARLGQPGLIFIFSVLFNISGAICVIIIA